MSDCSRLYDLYSFPFGKPGTTADVQWHCRSHTVALIIVGPLYRTWACCMTGRLTSLGLGNPLFWVIEKICPFTYKHNKHNWTASSEFGTYRLCEQRRFRRACASAQSRQNLRCSLIKAVSQEEPSDRKPDPWPLWIAGHAQLKFVMTECSKTQIRLTGLI